MLWQSHRQVNDGRSESRTRFRPPGVTIAAIAAIAIAGFVVRYHDIGSQVLLDDEWHSIGHVSAESLWTVCSTYFAQATSIPVNIYARLLLDTWGWSELSLRLPSILATSATMLVLPLTAYRAFGRPGVAIAIALLFAASQFWVFYGESSRPYAPFLLFVVLALHFLEKANRSGRTADYVWFGVTGALARLSAYSRS